MKATFSAKPLPYSNPTPQPRLAGFSRRLARPSLSQTVSSLNAALTIDDLWDATFLDRLQAPMTRRHY